MARFAAVAAAVVLILTVTAAPEVEAKKWTVGEGKFWNPNVNYTIWAQDKHFYLDDWLYFVYDRYQQNVLEVNKTDYENCISDHPLRNWSRGAGRDVVPLNAPRHYYFLSSGGFCFSGMKLAVKVEKLPPPPEASPAKSLGISSMVAGIAQFFLPVIVMWNVNLELW
ncbi:PREDICTED: lamin-like protein [Tarenaya hassleriana]|uniref:lamin-like protein n=1 Tax=Tarenaya hassleriana TaxID=28532 RepID=UPI00053C50D3|nr:PREDICTED: lamin-like protein [Tarenaya hassleriana]